MVQIGPLIVNAVSEKSKGHFDPLIGRDVVWMVFIHTAFSFWCGSQRPPQSSARFEHLKISGRNSHAEITLIWACRAHTIKAV